MGLFINAISELTRIYKKDHTARIFNHAIFFDHRSYLRMTIDHI